MFSQQCYMKLQKKVYKKIGLVTPRKKPLKCLPKTFVFAFSAVFKRMTIISIFQSSTFWSKSTQVANKTKKTKNEIQIITY